MKMYSEHRLSISKNTEPTCLKLHDSFIWETQLNHTFLILFAYTLLFLFFKLILLFKKDALYY